MWITQVELISDRGDGRGMSLINVESRAELRHWPAGSGVQQATFTADGLKLLTVDGDIAKVWDIEKETELAQWSHVWPGWWATATDPEGRRVLAWPQEGQSAFAPGLTAPPQGSKATVFELHPEDVTGAFFLFADEEKGCRRFDGHTAATLAATFSLDGRFVLTGSMDTTARYWALPERSAPPPLGLPYPRPLPLRLLDPAEAIGLPK